MQLACSETYPQCLSRVALARNRELVPSGGLTFQPLRLRGLDQAIERRPLGGVAGGPGLELGA